MITKNKEIMIILGCCFMLVAMPEGVLALTKDEVLLAEHLRTYTRQTNDFKPLSGEILFESRFTGLKDPSPYVRSKSAEIIADYGQGAQVEQLVGAARNETDEQARQRMSDALSKLQARQEARLVGVLWEHTRNSTGENKFKMVLGEEEYEGALTGLKDTRPFVRLSSVKIILQLSGQDLSRALFNAARIETDPAVKEEMYLAYLAQGLGYARDKERFIQGFLDDCAGTIKNMQRLNLSIYSLMKGGEQNEKSA